MLVDMGRHPLPFRQVAPKVHTLLHTKQQGKALSTVLGHKAAGTRSNSAGRRRFFGGLRTANVS